MPEPALGIGSPPKEAVQRRCRKVADAIAIDRIHVTQGCCHRLLQAGGSLACGRCKGDTGAAVSDFAQQGEKAGDGRRLPSSRPPAMIVTCRSAAVAAAKR